MNGWWERERERLWLKESSITKLTTPSSIDLVHLSIYTKIYIYIYILINILNIENGPKRVLFSFLPFPVGFSLAVAVMPFHTLFSFLFFTFLLLTNFTLFLILIITFFFSF